MEDVTLGGAQPLPDHLRAPNLHAGFWLRFAAFIIDSFILSAAAFVLYVLLALVVIVPAAASGGQHRMSAMLGFVMVLFAIVLIAGNWLYFALCQSSRWQATPGKLALGLQVTDLYGRRIGFGRATGRYFGKILSGMIFDIGYMLAGWTARKQALHDLLAGCCVVHKGGLEALERGEPTGQGVPASGMPGWAIALIAIGGFFFMVIPIVAILAAIAIPAYQNYLIRAQTFEGVVLARGAEAAVAKHLSMTGSLPDDNAATGLAAPDSIDGKYVESVEIRQGTIVVTFGNNANRIIGGDHLVLVPQGGTSITGWKCGSPDIKVKYLPSACRD